MSPVLSGMDQPDQPDPELPIHINAPEEFAGFAMGELNGRRGLVTGIDAKSGRVVIQASLPASEYDGLKRAIDQGTQGRGTVEHASYRA